MADDAQFERLYEDNVGAIAAYFRARTDRESALDGVARTFEIAWRRFPDVPDDARPWLFGVARRVLSDQRRTFGRHESLVERLGELLTVDGGATEASAMRDDLAAALESLPPVQREAILLVVWDGLSYREASIALGCSTGALALRVHRARAKLQVAIRHEERRENSGGGVTNTSSASNSSSPREAL